MIRELAQQTEFLHTTVLPTLKEHLDIKKIASRWVPHHLTEMQEGLRLDAARNHLERYECKGDAFACRFITLDHIVPARTEKPIKRIPPLRVITRIISNNILI
ncbi:mariner Mos1 transposase [Trichonephila clavata]|uniref:Mariner Mos1 transposase n=1 Tax=Trichonephila clavata TaxID=2740835 RepID=A0A8X6IA08_TRICU|nr:mariner Mos1 transposase [Trichonephila clavata]